MSNQHLSRLHRRLDGLAKVIGNKLAEADSPGRPMSMRERADLRFILSRIKTMLRDDQREAEQTVGVGNGGNCGGNRGGNYSGKNSIDYAGNNGTNYADQYGDDSGCCGNDSGYEGYVGERGDIEMPVRHSKQYLNTQCEFFDVDSNRIQCAIGCDMYRCSRNCIYATNVPGSLPPYCTKYMKGWIDR